MFWKLPVSAMNPLPFWADPPLGKYLPGFDSSSGLGLGAGAHCTTCGWGQVMDRQPQGETPLLTSCLQLLCRPPGLGSWGVRSHRAFLTSCSSQTHWHFFLPGKPPQLLAASQRGGRGRGREEEQEGGGRQGSPPRAWTYLFVPDSLSSGVLY